MASSNRHWPSMFKSKPCNPTHHQWQHDINSSLISSPSCIRPPYAPGQGCEERTPEPKPRWNPRPEQIRILEAIFNSGMVNPPRDEIRRIRAQLQEYGQVGDANVFYWFQNRKSRSKHKQRLLHGSKTRMQPAAAPPPSKISSAQSPSSSSSDKSSHNNSSEKSLSVGPTTVIDLLNSPTASVNQPFLYPSADFLFEPFLFPMKRNTEGEGLPSANITQELCFPNVVDQNPSFLLSDLMLMNDFSSKKDGEEGMKLQQQFSYGGATPVIPTVNSIVPPSLSVPSLTADQLLQGSGPTKSTVFINDVCFDVGVGPFNVREAFGDDAVLFQSSGQPVLTDEWGVTVQPLQDGGSYYLLRPFTPSPHEKQTTIHHLI